MFFHAPKNKKAEEEEENHPKNIDKNDRLESCPVSDFYWVNCTQCYRVFVVKYNTSAETHTQCENTQKYREVLWLLIKSNQAEYILFNTDQQSRQISSGLLNYYNLDICCKNCLDSRSNKHTFYWNRTHIV